MNNIFALLRTIATEEFRGARNTLCYMIISFYGLCILQLIFDGNWFVAMAGFVFWLGGILLLFRVPSLLRIAGLGEVLELVRITKTVPGAEDNQVPGAIENQLSVFVWDFTEKMVFLHSTYCLIIPLFPLRNNPWIIFLFTITAVVVILCIWRSKSNWVRPIALFTSVVLLAVNVFFSFPQLVYYTGLEKLIGSSISSGTAKTAIELTKLIAKQRDAQIKQAYQNALTFRRENPNKDLPPDIKNSVEAADMGLTITEYAAKIKAEATKAEAQKRTADEAMAKAITEAMDKDKITSFPATIEIIGGYLGHRSIDVPKGKYAVYPPDTEVNLGEGRKTRDGGLFEVLNDHQWVGFRSPTGQSKITIIQQE